jgi:hypothetical protein
MTADRRPQFVRRPSSVLRRPSALARRCKSGTIHLRASRSHKLCILLRSFKGCSSLRAVKPCVPVSALTRAGFQHFDGSGVPFPQHSRLLPPLRFNLSSGRPLKWPSETPCARQGRAVAVPPRSTNDYQNFIVRAAGLRAISVLAPSRYSALLETQFKYQGAGVSPPCHTTSESKASAIWQVSPLLSVGPPLHTRFTSRAFRHWRVADGHHSIRSIEILGTCPSSAARFSPGLIARPPLR